MQYYINLFSPETAEAFVKSSQDITGFRISQKAFVHNRKVGPGDKFICYVTRIQRFIGVLEITGESFIDNTPIFLESDDPFILRFKVKPIVWLPLEKSLPIRTDRLWKKLTFTKNLPKQSNEWTHMVFASPRSWPVKDAEIVEQELIKQKDDQLDYPFSGEELKKLKKQKIRISDDKEVFVTVPEEEERVQPKGSLRESHQIQAKLAMVGELLGFKVWLPRNDRLAILKIWKPAKDVLLEELPMTFEETTLKTISNIDLLWVKRRSIVRAFEVEGTTSIYSGILRMADLLALQPMISINIHIVASSERREEVFRQISRPVFTFMENGPLYEKCSYISYESIEELSKEKRLKYMSDSIIEEFAEYDNG